MKKRVIAIVLAVLGLTLVSSNGVFASTSYPTGSTGVDVGSPNCTASLPVVNFGIVGTDSGIVYSHNSCLSAQASHFANLSLYVNTGLNASTGSQYYLTAQNGCNGDKLCAAYNYGYNAAKSSLAYVASQGISAGKWWLDVETGNTWNADVLQNQKSLQGAYDALTESSPALIGVYSTTAQWQAITGSWKNNWPSWGATTYTTSKQAQTYCSGHQFTGGPSLLMQFKAKQSKLDQDVAC